jgi:hypothetical protein
MSQAGALASGSSSAGVYTLTGNSGGAVSPTGNNIFTLGSGSLIIVGDPGTSTLTTELTGLTEHDVLIGGPSNTLVSVSPSTAGMVLTSNGPSLDPSFQNVPSSAITLIGDTGSITGTTLTVYADQAANNSGASVEFLNDGISTSTLNLTDGNSNTMLGSGAGTVGASGIENTAIGDGACGALTSGNNNVAVGYQALNVFTGDDNIAIGSGALQSNIAGIHNIAMGSGALQNNTGPSNMAIGYQALNANISGEYNYAFGEQAMLANTTGSFNFALGPYTMAQSNGSGNSAYGIAVMYDLTSGSNNNAFGANGIQYLTTGNLNSGFGDHVLQGPVAGSNNTAMGAYAGPTGDFSNTTSLGYQANPTADNMIFIGNTSTTSCYVTGITGTTPTDANSPQIVVCDNTSNLTVVPDTTSGYVLTSNAPNSPTFQALPGGSITIFGDIGFLNGSNLTIYANQSALACGSSVLFTNSGTTSTFSVSDGNSNTIIGVGSGNFSIGTGGAANTALGNTCLSSCVNGNTNVAIGSASLENLTSGSYNTALGGGTGLAYSAAESNNLCLGVGVTGVGGESNAVHIADITASSFAAHSLSIGAQGTTTSTLIGGINGQTPTDGNSPQVTVCDNTGVLTVVPDSTAGYVLTSNSPNSPTFQPAAASLTITGDSGSITGSSLTIYADQTANNSGATVAFFNSGTVSTFNLSDPSGNTMLGSGAGTVSETGANNTALGSEACAFLTSGSANTVIGSSAGTSYNGGESNNICLGSSVIGINGESNAIHIGDNGSFHSCNIGGIYGETPIDANSPQVILCDNTSNLTVVPDPTPLWVLTSNSPNSPTFQAIPVQAITITGDGGGPLTSTSFTLSGGSTGLSFFGSGTTELLTGTLDVPYGGTGDTSFTAYAPVCGGTTSTGALQSADTGIATAGFVLTSNGSSALPSFQAPSGGGGALILIQTQTASLSTALDFTTGITTTYNNYLILSDNVTDLLFAGTYFGVQFSTNGGSTYISSGYLVITSSSTVLDLKGNASFGGATITNSLTAQLFNLTSGTGPIMGFSENIFYDSSVPYFDTGSGPSGYNGGNITVNALRIKADDGSAFSGTFSLYGYVQ